MAIIVTLDRQLAMREMSLTEFSALVGRTIPNASKIKMSKSKAIRFSTLAAICNSLGCQPGDLLEYRTDSDLAQASGEGGKE